TANIGVTASINNVGQLQLTTQTPGKSQTIALSNVGGQLGFGPSTITGSQSGITNATALNAGDTITVKGSTGLISYTVQAGDTVATLNGKFASTGVTVSVVGGQVQFSGGGQPVVISGLSGQ